MKPSKPQRKPIEPSSHGMASMTEIADAIREAGERRRKEKESKQ